MNDSDPTNLLLRIHKAVDSNFKCYRKGRHEDYNLPLRLMDSGSVKLNHEEHFTVDIRFKGEQKVQPVWLIQPIVMAVGIARQYNIDDSEIMAFWGIETHDELKFKLACFNALNNQAVRAIERGGKTYYETSKDREALAYRWFLKYELVSNHIRLHTPTQSVFFDNSIIDY